MRITKVYTRTGDQGTTRLVGGRSVSKNHVRVAAYGSVDELNAVLGIVRTFNRRSDADRAVVDRLDAMLHRAQNDLFDVGAELATPPADRWEGMHLAGDAEVTRIEEWIDALNEDLGPLVEFILPGGGPVGAFFHQARTVCRRAERDVVTLMDTEPETGTGPMRYLNRLSDFLFVAGRWAAKAHGEEEYLWEKKPRG
jgi:cob(I)alamin adenosyltransferase